MIAVVKQTEAPEATTWQEGFLEMMPMIEQLAHVAFRDLDADAKEDAVSEVVTNAMCAYQRLHERGELQRAFARGLARYAIAQFRDGRRVGSPLNVLDISSAYCQRRKQVKIQSLSSWNCGAGEWRDILVEDKTATPADLAASRIDFPAFLATLSRRDRRLAEKLATGESTSRAAKLFRISAGRVSQLRQELKRAWERFHEPAPAAAPA